MPVVHYYLGRPAHVLTAAMSRRSPEGEHTRAAGHVHSGIPGQPATGLTGAAQDRRYPRIGSAPRHTQTRDDT
jgi:hypothetical protein